MIETWKPIPGYDGYIVSSYGRVRNLLCRHKTKRNKDLAYRPGGYKKRYMRVSLGRIDAYVHRLVLLAFKGSPPTANYQASHINGNPVDNRVENLVWETPYANSSRKIIHGTSGKGEKNSTSKLKQKDAELILKEYINGESSKDLCLKYGVSNGNICSIIGRRTWVHVSLTKRQEKDLKTKRAWWIRQGLLSTQSKQKKLK